jgi:hypothetical protein
MFTCITVGEKFSFPVPCGTGAIATISGSVLDLIVQINNMTALEKKALEKGIKLRAWQANDACGLFISIGDGKITLDAPINAAFEPGKASIFLQNGGNNVNYYILDRGITRRQGLFGLESADVALLKQCFRQQLEKGFGQEEWTRILARLYRQYPSPDLLPVKPIEAISTEGIENGISNILTKAPAVSLHKVVNRLVESKIDNDMVEDMISRLLPQMKDGYRLAFPCFITGKQILQSVVLLALASDPRLKGIRQLQVPSDATHVLVFLAFDSNEKWLQQANKIVRLFPEQPDAPEFVI